MWRTKNLPFFLSLSFFSFSLRFRYKTHRCNFHRSRECRIYSITKVTHAYLFSYEKERKKERECGKLFYFLAWKLKEKQTVCVRELSELSECIYCICMCCFLEGDLFCIFKRESKETVVTKVLEKVGKVHLEKEGNARVNLWWILPFATM